MAQAISYIRVFASERSLAGPGLEAQREILEHFAAAGGFHIAREYIEVERGSGPDRLQGRSALIRALKRARWLELPVLVAGTVPGSLLPVRIPGRADNKLVGIIAQRSAA